MSDANALKDQGNKAFAAKDYDKAVDIFSQALELDPTNHVLFSNRSAAYAGQKKWGKALEDAEKCVKLSQFWGKGYARKGAALHGLRRYDEAISAYEEGLKHEDLQALRKGLDEVRAAKDSGKGGDGALGLGQMFADPNLIGKLAANPRTQKHLADPAFVQKLQMMQNNPQLASSALQDPRMIDVLGVLMGIDIQGFTRPEGSDEVPSRASQPPPSDSPTQSSSKPTNVPPQPAEDVEMQDEDDEDVKAKKTAESYKTIGSEAYKKRDFEEASKQFQLAWETWPKDVTFLTNLGAVYFEQGDYDKAIETCEKAAEEGRSLRADYKLIAKAYGRIGSAYVKKDDLVAAIKYFQKSLTEHRTPDILNKLRETETRKAETERLTYIDPDKSAAAREAGNAKFKSGDFAGSVTDYTESIKRDPSDPRGYNNRAAAYLKLMALPEALKDVDEAIKVDGKFVKAYIRKSSILYSMRDYAKAVEAIQEAAEHDTEGQHTPEIGQQSMRCQQALYQQRDQEPQDETLERAMRDPEIANIMTDPVMQQILQQAQGDPRALQDHMKNPKIRQNIQKLINAGIIRTK